MRAAAFSRYGGPDVLEVVDRPVPEPGPGEVRVRVAASSVNPADWRLRSGQFRLLLRVRLPFVLGNDLAGVVDAVGPGTAGLAVGDRVLGLTATKAGGACAEHVVLPATQVALLPDGVRLADAAAVPLVGSTALQALRDRAEVREGDRVLVHGAGGGVGTAAVQVAKALGAVVTAAVSARGADALRELGADEVVDRESDALTARAGAFDVVLDAADALPPRDALRLLRPGGTAVSVNPGAALRAPGWLAWAQGGRRVRSVLVRPREADLQQLAEWLGDGSLRPVVERAYALEGLADAHRRSQTGRVRGKLVVAVDEALAAGSERGDVVAEPA